MQYEVTLKNRTPFGNVGDTVVVDKETLDSYGKDYFENTRQLKEEKAKKNDEAKGQEDKKSEDPKDDTKGSENDKTPETKAVTDTSNTAILTPNETK